MLETILKALGASDQVVSDMGPTATFVLALLAGGAFAQWVKFPLSRQLQGDAVFSWAIRTIAMGSTFVAAHYLSDKLSLALELLAALVQPLAYWVSLRAIRRWWPWIEVHAPIGSVDPPNSAFLAAAQRAADRNDSGQDSGV